MYTCSVLNKQCKRNHHSNIHISTWVDNCSFLWMGKLVLPLLAWPLSREIPVPWPAVHPRECTYTGLHCVACSRFDAGKSATQPGIHPGLNSLWLPPCNCCQTELKLAITHQDRFNTHKVHIDPPLASDPGHQIPGIRYIFVIRALI